MRRTIRAATLAALVLVAACVRTPPPSPPVTPPPPKNAAEAGVRLEPPRPIDPVQAARALAAFRLSCAALLKRSDTSGLTPAGRWDSLCSESQTIADDAAAAFFRDRFEWVQVGDGKAFATGYYEPEIAASRVRAPGYEVPIYGRPIDLVRCARADGTTGRGRLDATGACLPFFTRAEIDDGALADRGLEIAWAADPVALFFVEIQGSGRLRLPDGSTMRIGYAEQNGQPYVAVGRLLRDRGVLPPGGASMPAIVGWMRGQPDGGKALMRENGSYIFFRELNGAGPLGALNVAVTPSATVAADPAFVPLGAPVFLELNRPEASGLWVAQDTGGAIKGANRVDTFWGAGPAAESTAGGMSAKGSAWLLLPIGTVAGAPARP